MHAIKGRNRGSWSRPTWSTHVTIGLALSFLIGLDFARGQSFSADDYDRVGKIDVHIHIRTEDPGFVELAKKDRFRFVNIATFNADPEQMKLRHRGAFAQLESHPDRVAVASSFPMDGWDDPGWTRKTIQYLDQTFARGAVAVKVWKNLGMESRDAHGKVIMVDDPKLDPIFAHLAAKGIRLIGHLGEPKECWMPLEKMVLHRGYFSSHPEYHMYLHPEMPSYEDQIRARDHVLEKHPDLVFCAAHLASLEWSVDEMARFLDRFPKAVMETAARMAHFQYQSNRDRAKVRNFLIKYQDRVLYGTDIGVNPGTDPQRAIKNARDRWRSDWHYLATDKVIRVRRFDEPVKGLALPKPVVEKIFRLNAERFLPDSWKEK